jgi:hypothetical protein
MGGDGVEEIALFLIANDRVPCTVTMCTLLQGVPELEHVYANISSGNFLVYSPRHKTPCKDDVYGLKYVCISLIFMTNYQPWLFVNRNPSIFFKAESSKKR